MKFKKLFTKYLVIVLMCAMVVGFGLPGDAKAANCFYKGYIGQFIQFGTNVSVTFREKPIDAGMYFGTVGVGVMDLTWENTLLNTLRSAHQNNTKVGMLIITPGACPAPNLSLPGQTTTGQIVATIPPPLIP